MFGTLGFGFSASASGGGGGGFTTANNGLTANTSTNVQLGGTLIKDTTIDTNIFTLFLTGATDSKGIILDVRNTGNGTGGYFESAQQSAIVGYAPNKPTIDLLSLTYPIYAATKLNGNTAELVTRLRRLIVSGSVGVGTGIIFNLELPKLANNTTTAATQFLTKWTDVAAGLFSASFEIWTQTANVITRKAQILPNGQLVLDFYGTGAFTGTAAYSLAVDASGNIIEGSAIPVGAFVPLAGTEDGSPLTGSIKVNDNLGIVNEYILQNDTKGVFTTPDNYLAVGNQVAVDIFTGLEVHSNSTEIRTSDGTNTTKTEVKANVVEVSSDDSTSVGLNGVQDFTPNATLNSFIQLRALKSRYWTANTAPTTSNDDTEGFITNQSRWRDTSTQIEYLCTDNTTGDAVWEVVYQLRGENFLLVGNLGNPILNGNALYDAYQYAKTLTPNGLSIDSGNEFTIGIMSGVYQIPSDLFIDFPFLNITSLTTQCDVLITGGSLIKVTTNKVKITGIDVGTESFQIKGDFDKNIYTNCKGGDFSFTNEAGTTSGIFNSCVAGNNSFANAGEASGTFNNCIAGSGSFGGNAGVASGTFNNCVAQNSSFGGEGGQASGTFNNCTSGYNSFGQQGFASGVFNNCTSGYSSFGTAGVASGVFNNCIGDVDSFAGDGGTLTGQCFYCRITSSSNFQTVSGGGITRYCLNGDNTPDNQG
jgi:hypothetical protein